MSEDGNSSGSSEGNSTTKPINARPVGTVNRSVELIKNHIETSDNVNTSEE